MKIVSSDYDGTLYVNENISDFDRNSIQKLREKGHLFAINTGRNLTNIYEQFDKNSLEADYYIGSNGSIIANKNRKLIYKAKFDLQLAKEIVEFFNNNLSNDVLYIATNDGYQTGWKLFDEDYKIEKSNYTTTEEALQNEVITMFSQVRDDKNVLEIIDILENHFGNRAIFSNTAPFIDISQNLNNKATALIHLKNNDNNIKEIYTIGDDRNDLEMLRQFDGYTMEHAKDHMKLEIKQQVKSVGNLIDKILD